jgi:2,3-bisphosphoglycerate-independent phosphoglycerate mutase
VKYLIVIPEGAADEPVKDLDGATPLEAAETPALDRFSERARLGTVATTPRGLHPTSDVTLMSLLGYSPRSFPAGPAILESRAAGVPIPDGVSALRLNLVTVHEGVLLDLAAGGLGDAEAGLLFADLEHLARVHLGRAAAEWRIHPVAGHRGVLIDESGRSFAGLSAEPAACLLDKPINRHLPAGERSEAIRSLIDIGEELLRDHEVNATRRELGEQPATHVWPWGPGEPIHPPTFDRRFDGLRCVMICTEHLPAGFAALISWDVQRLPRGAAEAELGAKAIEALDEYDIVCVHAVSPETAAHDGDLVGKIEAINRIDEDVIGPVADRLAAYDHWRLLVAPSHATLVVSRCCETSPPPLMICGERITSVLQTPYHEATARQGDLQVSVGEELMEYFLFGVGIGRSHESG